MVGGGAPAFQAEPGVVISAASSVGVWEATGPDGIAFTVELLLADADGNFAGRQTVRGTRQIDAGGQRFTGEYTFAIEDPTGAPLLAGFGTEEGSRITVEPMGALPVASPATGTPAS